MFIGGGGGGGAKTSESTGRLSQSTVGTRTDVPRFKQKPLSFSIPESRLPSVHGKGVGGSGELKVDGRKGGSSRRNFGASVLTGQEAF
jgi:hypothetical protein